MAAGQRERQRERDFTRKQCPNNGGSWARKKAGQMRGQEKKEKRKKRKKMKAGQCALKPEPGALVVVFVV